LTKSQFFRSRDRRRRRDAVTFMSRPPSLGRSVENRYTTGSLTDVEREWVGYKLRRRHERRHADHDRSELAVLDALPFGDTQDFEDTRRGFLGTLPEVEIKNARGASCGACASTAS